MEAPSDLADEVRLRGALEELRTALNAGNTEESHTIDLGSLICIDVLIMFEEAHTLAESFHDGKEFRLFALQQALGLLYCDPLFSFLFSTSGNTIIQA